MKCTKQPRILANRPTQIHDNWEVRLSPRIFHEIRNLAAARRTTLTAITRYCLFRAIEPATLRMRPIITDSINRTKEETRSSDALHRHIVCFYGEDLVLVKLAAMRLQITVSTLIRIALHLFLPRLAMEFHSRKYVNEQKFQEFCIKRWMRIEQTALNIDKIPIMRGYTFASFPPWFWW